MGPRPASRNGPYKGGITGPHGHAYTFNELLQLHLVNRRMAGISSLNIEERVGDRS